MKAFAKYRSVPRRQLKNSKLMAAVIVLAVAVSILGVRYYLTSDSSNPCFEEALVTKVIDGDTVELVDGRTVRYLGIDTPETGEYFYDEAKDKNKELVEGKIVELQSGFEDKGTYDRLLRYVYADGVFVNAELVAQGYAKSYIVDPDERYSQILVQLEQYAKIKQKGMWEGDP